MKDILKNGVILMLYSLIAGSALAFVYLKTAPVIEARKAALANAVLLEVLPGMDGGYVPQGDPESFEYWSAYKGSTSGEADGYVFTAKGKGYSSTIETMVGVDKDGKVVNLKVVFQQETPGLGDQILAINDGESDPWYTRQFIGKSADDDLRVADDGGSIDAISGATISSRAVATSIQNGLGQLRAALTGGEFVPVEVPEEVEPADMPISMPEEADLVELMPGMAGGYDLNDEDDMFPVWTAWQDEGKSKVGGYLFVARKEGFEHNIDTLVAVDADGAVQALKILFLKETPDYGGRMKEVREGEDSPWFLTQFVGKTVDDDVKLADDGGNIDAVTDATISSTAFTGSMNSGLRHLKAALNGEEFIDESDDEDSDEDDEIAFLFEDDEDSEEEDEEIAFLFEDDEDEDSGDDEDAAMEPIDPADALAELFSEREYELNDEGDFEFYAAYADVAKIEALGYAFVVEGEGFESNIKTLVAVNSEFVIEAVKILFQDETEDYGANVMQVRDGEESPWFQRQFVGKKLAAIALKDDGGEIDAITDATISSTAVTQSIAEGLEALMNAVP